MQQSVFCVVLKKGGSKILVIFACPHAHLQFVCVVLAVIGFTDGDDSWRKASVRFYKGTNNAF